MNPKDDRQFSVWLESSRNPNTWYKIQKDAKRDIEEGETYFRKRQSSEIGVSLRKTAEVLNGDEGATPMVLW